MRFSILLPTRNRLDLLRFAVESVRRQSIQDWEIVVSDNASEDDVCGYVASVSDERIRYVRTAGSISVTENWNNALRHATGEYILMLGDDDALMPECLAQLSSCIDQWDRPDVIYVDAYQYAYPNVIPGHASAFVQRGYTEFLDGLSSTEPFWLNESIARMCVSKSMGFRVTFGFNMQHYLVSRTMVQRLSEAGDFFQSPYPDYYAANALLLLAKRVLVNPRPLVVIGISPKSFGYYYFNHREAEGDIFLCNTPSGDMKQRLERVLLPGSSMNSSWLYAMEAIKTNFDPANHIGINYRRYRLIQACALFAQMGSRAIGVLRPYLSISEVSLMALAILAIFPLWAIQPSRAFRRLGSLVGHLVSPYPRFDPAMRDVPFRNILELVEGSKPATLDCEHRALHGTGSAAAS